MTAGTDLLTPHAMSIALAQIKLYTVLFIPDAPLLITTLSRALVFIPVQTKIQHWLRVQMENALVSQELAGIVPELNV